MGWLMVAFDLPVVEDEDRKRASRFRNDLLDRGFTMMQESIYTRNCISLEKYKSEMDKIKSIAPNKGSITAFYLTDKQWENSINIALYEPINRRRNKAGQKNPAQLTFW